MKKIIFLFICFMGVSGSLLLSPVYCENINKPLEGIERSTPLNWGLEQPVWVMGKIDSISSKILIADDIEYRLSSDVKYYLENGSPLNRKNFVKGTMVKLVLSSKDRSIVTIVIKQEI